MLPCRQNKRKFLRRPLAAPRSALFAGGAGGAPEAQTGETSVSVTNANILSLRIRICVYFDDTGALSLLSHVLAALRSLRAPPLLGPSSGTSGPSAASFCFLFLLTVTVHELLLSFPLASAGFATGHSRQEGKREERKKHGRKGENWWDSKRGAWVSLARLPFRAG